MTFRLIEHIAFNPQTTELNVLGDFVAKNRGADFVNLLALSLRARTRSLTRHRAPHNQAALACAAHGAGQLRDYVN